MGQQLPSHQAPVPKFLASGLFRQQFDCLGGRGEEIFGEKTKNLAGEPWMMRIRTFYAQNVNACIY